jgi:uncharacterized protein YecT (DUF1311 family)
MLPGLVVLVVLLGVSDDVNCANAVTQRALHECADREARKDIDRMDDLIRKYRLRLDPNKKKLFDKAQRDWVGFRKSWCDYIGSGSEGGSVQPMVIGLCFQDLTQQRIKHLEYVTSCEEGDLSCPAPKSGR